MRDMNAANDNTSSLAKPPARMVPIVGFVSDEVVTITHPMARATPRYDVQALFPNETREA